MTSDDKVNEFLESMGTSIPRSRKPFDGLPVVTIFSIDQACNHAWEEFFPFAVEWGNAMNLNTDMPDECLLNWCDLRELMVAKHIKTSAYFGNKELYALADEIRDYLGGNLDVDERVEELWDEIAVDLGFCAMNHKLNEKPNFWSDVAKLYLSGLIPCGWQGTYPDGAFITFAMSENEG